MFNRNNVSPSQELRMILLGSYGFYAKTIQKRVRTTTGETFSLGTIYKTLRNNGIRLRDYRNGVGMEAREMMTMTNRVIVTSKDNAGHDETIKKLRTRFKRQAAVQDKKKKEAMEAQAAELAKPVTPLRIAGGKRRIA